jgi:hypothetical protein
VYEIETVADDLLGEREKIPLLLDVAVGVNVRLCDTDNHRENVHELDVDPDVEVDNVFDIDVNEIDADNENGLVVVIVDECDRVRVDDKLDVMVCERVID